MDLELEKMNLMRKDRQSSFVILGFVLVAVVSLPFIAVSSPQSEKLPGAIGDQEFWRMVTELSESSGAFQQQFMSNEDSAQFVIPSLKEIVRPGGVYIGVGSEQNFTYIAAVQPRLAFIVDIRRDNLIEHLMYKALFELSADRADFLSRLFSRKRPPALDTDSSVTALFDAYREVETDSKLYEESLGAVMDRLVVARKFQLSETDKANVGRIMNFFRMAGPYTLKGTGDPTNPTYAQLMAATDLTGRKQSYLASEENFKMVQELEKRNLIVPLVGDFAGDKAIAGIGRYLKERNTTVNVFYVSNVERYLFDQGSHGKQFYANVAVLPVDPSSVFIRSVTSDISRRLGIRIPDGAEKWRTFLSPITDSLTAFANGRMQTYRDLFEIAR